MEFYKNLPCGLEITAWAAGYSIAVIIFYIYSKWSEFLATDTEVPGSIPGATRFSE